MPHFNSLKWFSIFTSFECSAAWKFRKMWLFVMTACWVEPQTVITLFLWGFMQWENILLTPQHNLHQVKTAQWWRTSQGGQLKPSNGNLCCASPSVWSDPVPLLVVEFVPDGKEMCFEWVMPNPGQSTPVGLADLGGPRADIQARTICIFVELLHSF